MAACDKTSAPVFNPDGGSDFAGEVSVAYLKSLCTGQSRRITEDYTICGCVTANDCHGEWYKSIVVQDKNGGGIEILLDSYALYREFPVYSTVRINCNGLALGRQGGKIELGAQPTGEYAVDRIAYSDITRHVVRIDKIIDIEPKRIRSFLEFIPSDISSTVIIDDVRIVDNELGKCWCDVDSQSEPLTTERHILDRLGNSLRVSTLGTCNYATEPIPQGLFTIAGIVEYSAGKYLLRISNHLIII